ncbi:MAG: hypothetical protein ACX932_01455 [Gammaproteobacteria bacterium]
MAKKLYLVDKVNFVTIGKNSSNTRLRITLKGFLDKNTILEKELNASKFVPSNIDKSNTEDMYTDAKGSATNYPYMYINANDGKNEAIRFESMAYEVDSDTGKEYWLPFDHDDLSKYAADYRRKLISDDMSQDELQDIKRKLEQQFDNSDKTSTADKDNDEVLRAGKNSDEVPDEVPTAKKKVVFSGFMKTTKLFFASVVRYFMYPASMMLLALALTGLAIIILMASGAFGPALAAAFVPVLAVFGLASLNMAIVIPAVVAAAVGALCALQEAMRPGSILEAIRKFYGVTLNNSLVRRSDKAWLGKISACIGGLKKLFVYAVLGFPFIAAIFATRYRDEDVSGFNGSIQGSDYSYNSSVLRALYRLMPVGNGADFTFIRMVLNPVQWLQSTILWVELMLITTIDSFGQFFRPNPFAGMLRGLVFSALGTVYFLFEPLKNLASIPARLVEAGIDRFIHGKGQTVVLYENDGKDDSNVLLMHQGEIKVDKKVGKSISTFSSSEALHTGATTWADSSNLDSINDASDDGVFDNDQISKNPLPLVTIKFNALKRNFDEVITKLDKIFVEGPRSASYDMVN